MEYAASGMVGRASSLTHTCPFSFQFCSRQVQRATPLSHHERFGRQEQVAETVALTVETRRACTLDLAGVGHIRPSISARHYIARDASCIFFRGYSTADRLQLLLLGVLLHAVWDHTG